MTPAAFATANGAVPSAVTAFGAHGKAELAARTCTRRRRKVLESLGNHWTGLTVFVEHPEVPMDNNTAERSERGPVVGRKNYYCPMTLFNPVFNCLTPIVIKRSKTQAEEGLTPADEAGSVVLRQPPASKLANLFRIDVRDHALGLVTQQLGGRVREHPPGGSLLKQHPGRDSLAMKRRSCGWSEDFMLEVPTGATI